MDGGRGAIPLRYLGVGIYIEPVIFSMDWRTGAEVKGGKQTILCIRCSSVLPNLRALLAAEGLWVVESLTSRDSWL